MSSSAPPGRAGLRAQLRGLDYEAGSALLAGGPIHPVQGKDARVGTGPARDEGQGEPWEMGTELWVERKVRGGLSYHHAGVYSGDGKIIHVAAEPGALERIAAGESLCSVHETDVASFAKGGTPRPGPHATQFTPLETYVRARAAMGPWDYNPLTNNCQHFSSEMVAGSRDSPEATAFEGAFLRQLEPLAAQGREVMRRVREAGGWLANLATRVPGGAVGQDGQIVSRA